MIEYIYSKIDGKTTHIIVKPREIPAERKDIIEANNWLQLAVINLQKGKTFQAHKHNTNSRTEMYHAQEAWVCLTGSVNCILYDVDDNLLCHRVIMQGDIAITLRGGHNYKAITDSKVLEFKTGKYISVAKDKTFI